MAEYLVIGGKNEDAVLHALAVAADIATKKADAQVDIATSPALAPVARLGKTPRRVVEVKIAPSAPGVSLDALKNAPSGGWKGVFSFAQKAAKTAALSARNQFGQYRELAEELRIVRYDAVVDLDGDAAGLLAAKLAAADKVFGFAADNLPDAAPGASLLYHDTRAVPRNLPRREQCRRLAADCLGYTPPARPEWDFADPPPPANAPAPPFLLIGGKIPEPFMEILRAAGPPLFAPESPADILAAARICECAAGNGIAVALAAAAGARALFIGGAANSPPEATATESPTALQQEIGEILGRRAPLEKESATTPESSAPAQTPPTSQKPATESAAAANVDDSPASDSANSESAESTESVKPADSSPGGSDKLRIKR
ncbi:MAG: hypothetical protein ACR2QC_11470 [Gammaproteobacteria bacterium]